VPAAGAAVGTAAAGAGVAAAAGAVAQWLQGLDLLQLWGCVRSSRFPPVLSANTDCHEIISVTVELNPRTVAPQRPSSRWTSFHLQ